MDDTLEHGQVKEIGRQVSDSPFAQELTARINRVTRQRRLTVPSTSGSEATDPNLVASYLDNDLDPDAVAEFEKRCLTSDVNLAEVASVHQILSLLGHKVKVPDEARKRMYQLVKGRETTRSRRRAAAKPVVKEPVTKPIQPWVVPEPPRRPWLERFGPAAACIFLILLSSWAAWKSLTMPPAPVAPAVLPGAPEAAAAGAAPAGQPGAGATKVAEAGRAAEHQPGGASEPAIVTPPAPEPADTAKPADLAKAKPAPPAAVPSGSAGLAEKPDGVLLRYNEERREWDRLTSETPLKTSDRLLCLEPFRAWIVLGKIRIGLVRQTEVRILSQPTDPVPSIELLQGRLLVRQPALNSLKVVFAKQPVTVEMSSDSSVGLERVDLNQYGQPITQPQSLGVLCQQGAVTLTAGGKSQPLKSSDTALVAPAGQMQTGHRDDLPPWLSQAEPTGLESQLKEQFVKLFHDGRPVLAEVVTALEDDKPENKQLAVAALAALGDLSLLMPTLSRPNDPVARRATLAAIRGYMMQGPEASGRVRAELDDQFGENLGGLAQHMLIGYTPQEGAKPELLTRLVGLLSPEQESIGLRELALDTLKRLTGRDDLGYDPDKPAGKGLDAWNDLVRRNELRPAATPSRTTSGTSRPAPPPPSRNGSGSSRPAPPPPPRPGRTKAQR
jgi:hypothetical protein